MSQLSANQRAWLALEAVPGLERDARLALAERFGGATGLAAAGAGDLRRAGLGDGQVRALLEPDRNALEPAAAWLGRPRNHLLCLDDEDYPSLLRRIPGPPPLLYVHGEPAALWHPQLAVVGSRNPTPGGRDNARDFCRHLARAGFTITSGLAQGIDGEAHQAALDAGGATVAVTGTGLERVYPARHRELAHRIGDSGALVSELPPDAGARRSHFPSRNRIISGLSLGVLVVEAGVRSGSLITARHATDQGREVFAIPGSIHNPLARGCHRLIRQGAKLVETAADIVEELAPMARELGQDIDRALANERDESGSDDGPAAALDDEERRVLDALGHDPTPVDTVVERTGLTAESVSSMLLVMELRGLVNAAGGGKYCRGGRQWSQGSEESE